MSTQATANPADIAAVQDILKEVFPAEGIESQLYEDTIALDWVESVTEYTDSDGLKASVPIKTGRTGGIGARAIGQNIPSADHQRAKKASYNYKNLYLTVKVHGPVVARMQTDRQAVVREIDFEVTNGILDFKRDLCRQIHGDGSANVLLAALPGNAASTTILLGATNYPVIERGWLYEGLPIDVGTLADPDARTATQLRITSVVDSESAPAVVVSASVTPSAGDFIFIGGNRTDAGGSNEINGFANIVDNAAVLGGLDPSTETYWKSVVEHNSGTPRALSLSLMNTTNRKIRQKGNAGVSDVLGDLLQQQKYYELLQATVRHIGDADLSAGKVEGPQFNNVTFTGDADCRPGRIYFLQKKAFQMYSAGDIGWQNQTTGGDILAWDQDYDAFVARAAKYCQLGTDRRRSSGVLKDLNLT